MSVVGTAGSAGTTGIRPTAAIRLLALDLDGTLLETGRSVRPALLDALRDVSAAGVRCLTATGRPLAFQLELLDRLGPRAAAGWPHALTVDERELFLLDEFATLMGAAVGEAV